MSTNSTPAFDLTWVEVVGDNVRLTSTAHESPVWLTPDHAAQLASKLVEAADEAIHASRSSRRVTSQPVGPSCPAWLGPLLETLPSLPCSKLSGHSGQHVAVGASGASVVWTA
jgi:hypothetical protein